MPYKYAAELMCDWIGAARAYLGDKFNFVGEYKWWINKRGNTHPKMHPNTVNFVTEVFRILAECEEQGYCSDKLFNDELLKYCYKQSHNESELYTYKGEKL